MYHLDYDPVFSTKTHHLLENKKNVDLFLNEDIIRATRPEMRLYELRQTDILANDPTRRTSPEMKFRLGETGRLRESTNKNRKKAESAFVRLSTKASADLLKLNVW